ncbi:ciliary microtubule associated protein 1A isoform X1 [Halyomorpha halys]|uniref:ciliary microtubule associated protein 1A isoform X1 n=1 Tax=Halyomorpha halys TaxID=286706 RepID=UPI0006D4E206|nr:outer dense fiber protein 3-like isoform X1 [Halyomorpha halys]XP_014288531.1 outer dense fiber protein 3-like isoform X1 [Halyomorpha halys]XP_024216032.1 outer dense fiber protein 3-like isoform X1 [Halyomorpha halys]
MGGFQQRPWTPTKRRGPIAAEYTSPGPACVTLPNLFGSITNDSKKGRAPAFSFGSRHGGKNDSIGPGPGQYNVTGLSAKGKDCPPSATLHSRGKEAKPEATPAPGDYNPERSEKVIHDKSPKYTFGLKTQVEKPSQTPGPNTYSIQGGLGGDTPSFTISGRTKEVVESTGPGPNVYKIPAVVGGHGPAYSLSGRTKEPTDDRLLTPGPGSYNSSTELILPKSPAYSVAPRIQPPTSNLIKPGPGSYSPEKIRIDATPSVSFGIKHSPYLGNLKKIMK